MRSLSTKPLTWRTAPVLVAGLLAGAVLMQPAVAHVKKSLSHLTKHLDPRYYNVGEKVGDADTLDGVDSSGFARAGASYTKAESDGRYAPTVHNHDDRYFTEAESDARYINTGEKAADSDLLDGKDSTAFGSFTSHNYALSDECDTPFVWNECGVVDITVPAGKSYNVSVWNSGTWLGTSADINASFCAARRNLDTETTLSCITPFGIQSSGMVTIIAGKHTAAASSGETTLGPGNWRLSLGVYPTAEVAFSNFGKVVTKILVRNAAGPVPRSAITVVRPKGRSG